MVDNKVGLEKQMDESRWCSLASLFHGEASKGQGGELLKHIQVKASRSDKLEAGRRRHMRAKENPKTAAHRTPN
jgi:hypothetical protein